MCEKMKKDGILTGGAIWCDMSSVETAADNIEKAARDSGIQFDGVFSPHEQVCACVAVVWLGLARDISRTGNGMFCRWLRG